MYRALIDLEKTFDMVPRVAVCRCLKKTVSEMALRVYCVYEWWQGNGVNEGDDAKGLAETYREVTAMVKTTVETCEAFGMKTGRQQRVSTPASLVCVGDGCHGSGDQRQKRA